MSIFSFDLGNPYSNSRGLACLVTERAQNIYMSERAIYVSYTDYNFGEDSSVIHKIYVRRNRIIPFANGRVRGSILNQFSMDEFGRKQILRVATTSTDVHGRTRITSSNVYCLDYYLNRIGHLGGIAPGERIFSARYVDRRLYLVTFRQVDPFFVISLSNHRRPKILGELKITGFSRYLHPYDEDTIIGLGRQADLNGRQLGLKISLFDVTNVRNPIEKASFELEEKYASSAAEWEHKAFLFSRVKNLLVIPGKINQKDLKFNGAFVFYIDRSTI